MTREPRKRHYVSKNVLTLAWPLFRYSIARDAYVLRYIGSTRGPVLKQERRKRQRAFLGRERRGRLVLS